jgi:anti-anti-sigma factor
VNAPKYQLISGSVDHGALVIEVAVKHLRDADVAYSLRDEMVSMLSESGADNVVLDLSQVEFIGSVGLLAFLAMRRSLGEINGRIVLCNVSDTIHQMLTTCKLASAPPSDSPFELAADVQAALASFG